MKITKGANTIKNTYALIPSVKVIVNEYDMQLHFTFFHLHGWFSFKK